jgi:hypothetical protein
MTPSERITEPNRKPPCMIDVGELKATIELLKRLQDEYSPQGFGTQPIDDELTRLEGIVAGDDTNWSDIATNFQNRLAEVELERNSLRDQLVEWKRVAESCQETKKQREELEAQLAAAQKERDKSETECERLRLLVPTTAQAMVYQSLLNKYDDAIKAIAAKDEALLRWKSYFQSEDVDKEQQGEDFSYVWGQMEDALSTTCGESWKSPWDYAKLEEQLAAAQKERDESLAASASMGQMLKLANQDCEVKDEALRDLDTEIRLMANGLLEDTGNQHLVDGWLTLLRNTSEKALKQQGETI